MEWRPARWYKISVSASVNLSLHHKVQKFSSGTGSPGWSRKKGRKMVVVVCTCTCRTQDREYVESFVSKMLSYCTAMFSENLIAF